MIIIPEPANIRRAASLLEKGDLVVFPTETVYGLGGDARSDSAVAHIFAAKNRPTFNPLIVHTLNLESAAEFGFFNKTASALAQYFWPGPLTLVVPRKKEANLSLLAVAGLDTVALRVPSHPIAQALLKAFDNPIVAPSANKSGYLSPTEAWHVQNSLGREVPFIIDGGQTYRGLESTILQVMDEEVILLRHGALSQEDIEVFLGKKLSIKSSEEINAPGQLTSHYSPRLSLRLNVVDPRPGEAFIAFGQTDHLAILNLSEDANLREAAANLFSFLHNLDYPDLYTGIAVAPIPKVGIGAAINDRLERAAAPK
jgi:L-threonylcarbamoyladenylate synthase